MVTVATSPLTAKNPAGLPSQPQRIASVDILRGVVMIIMALDHTRDFFTSVRFSPDDMTHTNLPLFFTRLVTHYCAPVFAFLAGTGAFLSTRRGKSTEQISRFFFTRGLWLVLLELTIVDFAWGFVPWVHGGVIWGLGLSMIAMSLIVRLPIGWIAALGVAMVTTHNLLDRINPASFGKLYWMWILIHTPGRIAITDHFAFSARYVLIPWVGVMAAGFAFGTLLLKPDRRRRVFMLGLALTTAFFVLRAVNIYGNGIAGLPFGYPRAAGPWSVQSTTTLTIISFFNTLKYPPSLDYLLMTLGPALMLLGLLDVAKAERGFTRILVVFGRVPMFYYVLHLYVIHLLAIVVSVAYKQPILHGSVIADFAQKPAGYGHGLPFVYAMWLLAVTILYLPCKWFMEFRASHRDWGWLSYL